MFASYEIAILTAQLKKIHANSRKNPSSAYSEYLQVPYIEVFERQISEVENKPIKLNPTNGLIYKTTKRCTTDYIKITAYCRECQLISKTHGKYKLTVQKNPFDKDGNAVISAVTVRIEHEEHRHDIVQKVASPVEIPRPPTPDSISSSQVYRSSSHSSLHSSSRPQSHSPSRSLSRSSSYSPSRNRSSSRSSPNIKRKQQITGQDRIELAKEIISAHFGSAKRYLF